MSVASAIRARDAAQLPGRRDEDWRWTDLRGLIRAVPQPSAAVPAELVGKGPFAALAGGGHVIANGHGAPRIGASADGAPVALRVVSRGDGSHLGAASVVVGPGKALVLLESYEGRGAYLSQTDLSIELDEGASLERIVLADDDSEGVTVSQAQVRLAPRARYAQTVLTTGGRRQRLETRIHHPGGGATVRLDGAYMLSGKAHADITTEVVHAGPDGATDQLVKGVVRERARAVFQGRIVVAVGADRADARMGHHALILSDGAEVDARPELEIYADDVACGHGATVGALDEEALFYARQRGMSEDAARTLLTEAFIAEVTSRIGHDRARDLIASWIAERLA